MIDDESNVGIELGRKVMYLFIQIFFCLLLLFLLEIHIWVNWSIHMKGRVRHGRVICIRVYRE